MPLKAGGGEPAVFLVPSAGSTPLSLTKLAQASDCGRPLWSFVPPGLDDGAFPFRSVGDLAETYADSLLAQDPAGSICIAGHCLGGFVALELAHQLAGRGREIAGLLLLESFPPRGVRSTEGGAIVSTVDDATLLESETERLLKMVSEHIIDQFAGLPKAHAEKFGKMTYRYLSLGEDYLPERTGIPVVVLRTQIFDAAVFEGWRNVSSGEVSVELVPGGTYSMLAPPHVNAVAKRFDAALTGFSSGLA